MDHRLGGKSSEIVTDIPPTITQAVVGAEAGEVIVVPEASVVVNAETGDAVQGPETE